MSDYKELSKDELKKWMDHGKDFLLVDTLGPESYEKNHIPGAKMIDAHEDDFVEKVDEAAESKSQTIVVYCASFDCQLSVKAAEDLADAGFTNVYDYEGGIEDWKEDYELHTGEGAEEESDSKVCKFC